MTAFVIDNSVAIAWFLPNQATAYTDRLLERAMTRTLHAPSVWPLEFANALWGLQRRKLLSAEQVDEIVEKGEALAVEVDRHSPPMSLVLMLSRRHRLSTYDASYLELALRLRLPLAAKDGPLVEAAKKAGVLLTATPR